MIYLSGFDIVDGVVRRIVTEATGDEVCTAGENIVVNRWVERRADGKVYYASNAAAKINRCIGLAMQSASEGGSVKIRKSGKYYFNGFNLAATSNYFLFNFGMMAASVPTTGYIQCLGSSSDANTFDINIQAPIKIG